MTVLPPGSRTTTSGLMRRSPTSTVCCSTKSAMLQHAGEFDDPHGSAIRPIGSDAGPFERIDQPPAFQPAASRLCPHRGARPAGAVGAFLVSAAFGLALQSRRVREPSPWVRADPSMAFFRASTSLTARPRLPKPCPASCRNVSLLRERAPGRRGPRRPLATSLRTLPGLRLVGVSRAGTPPARSATGRQLAGRQPSDEHACARPIATRNTTTTSTSASSIARSSLRDDERQPGRPGKRCRSTCAAALALLQPAPEPGAPDAAASSPWKMVASV